MTKSTCDHFLVTVLLSNQRSNNCKQTGKANLQFKCSYCPIAIPFVDFVDLARSEIGFSWCFVHKPTHKAIEQYFSAPLASRLLNERGGGGLLL